MKKIIYLLLITVLFTACKKKKNVNPQPVDPLFANQNCQISKIEYTGSDGSDEGTLTFNYDDKGNLVKVEVKFFEEDKKGVRESHTYTHTYTYSKQRIVHTKPTFQDGTKTTTYSLDDSGKIISAEEIISNATASATTRNITYQYAGDGYLSKIITQDKVSGAVIKNTYDWQNGNLTSIKKEETSKNNIIFSSTETKSYEYGTDVRPVTFPFLDMIMTDDDEADSFLKKYFGKLSKNLPSREIEKYETRTYKDKPFEVITEYAYQKDDKGNITKISEVEKNPQKKDESFSAICRYNCK